MRTIRKTISIAALCIALAAALPGCDKTPENKALLKLTLRQTETTAGETVSFAVTSETAPDKDMTIDVESDNETVAAVPASLTLIAGEKSVTGEIHTIAEGSATITISAANAEIAEPSARLTVKAPKAVVDLSLTLKPDELHAGEKGEIIITTPVASESDITIKVKSSAPLIASVPATLILKTGEKTVKGELVAASAGSAAISIEAENIKISSYQKNMKVLEPLKIELTLSTPSKTIYVDKKMVVTVSTPAAPTTDINITLISSAPEVFTPVEPEIVLKAGEMSVAAEILGKTHGTATLSFVPNPAVGIVTDAVELSCETLLPEIYEVTSTSTVGPGNYWDNFKHELSPYNIGGIWYDYTTVWDGKYGIDVYKTMLEPYGGDFVGDYYKNMGVVKSVEYDTPIDENLDWIKNIHGSYPSFWTEDGYSIGSGELYVVCTLPSIAMNDPENVFYRAWLKIKSNGPYIEVSDGAICVNDAVFRVGMKAIE